MRSVLLWVLAVVFLVGAVGCGGATVKVDKDIPDGKVSGSNRIAYYTYAQQIVKDYLRNPNSAEFPSGGDAYEIVKTLNRFKVESWVDSKNSYGSMVRTDFIVIYEMEDDGKSFVLKRLELDGNVVFDVNKKS